MYRMVGANFLGQALSALVMLVALPFLFSHLTEGDLRFFAIFFTFFNAILMIDLGFSAALCREISIVNLSGSLGSVRALFTKWSKVFIVYQLILMLTCLAFLAVWVLILDYKADTTLLFLAIFTLILRLSSNMLKQVLIGIKHHYEMNLALLLGNLIRYVFPALIFLYGSASNILLLLILFWLCSVVCEVVLQYFFFLRATVKDATLSYPISDFDFKEVLTHKNFMFFSALSTFIWLCSSYLDRLAVDAFYSPSILATYTLVSTLCLSVFMVSTSVVTVAIPKFVEIWESGDTGRFRSSAAGYHGLAIGLIFPAWGVLVCLPEELFILWTGTTDGLDFVKSTLPVLASLNVIMALGSVVYAIHFATGNLGIHIGGSMVSTVVHFLIFFILITPYGLDKAIFGCLVFRTIWLFFWAHFSLNKKIQGVGFTLNSRTLIASIVVGLLYNIFVNSGSVVETTRLGVLMNMIVPIAIFSILGLGFILSERILTKQRVNPVWPK